jgi:hypothetical protein
MSARNRLLFLCLLIVPALVIPARAQYTLESAGPCTAPGVADSVKSILEGDGARAKDASGPFVEVWLNKSIPTQKPSEETRGSDFPLIPVNTLVGVIRYAKAGADFRGQPIQPGVYTMRFNLQPEDGDHQGASPRRDHLLLAPVSADQDAGAKLTFEQEVDLSRKASGTSHPSVLFLAMPESGAKFPSLQQGGGKVVLQVKSGSVELGITVVGKAAE